jgi:glycosyltransferase involved in cell wall biosynthesis
LEEALRRLGVDYLLTERPGGAPHWHLANSSRGALLQAPLRRGPFVVTAHDLRPRTRALDPLYRVVADPLVLRRAAAVVVHSAYAASLLADRSRAHVIPHPATAFASLERAAARQALGWDDEARIALLPGVPKEAKLVAEAKASVRAPWRLVVLGTVDDLTYARAFAAADAVFVLRRDSVGESNGPLLDALGAGRAVLATRVGSIAEVAGHAAVFCTPETIASGLDELWPARDDLERAARARAAELTWEASAQAHAALFAEVFG